MTFHPMGPMKVRLLNEWLSERDLEKEDVVCILDDRDSVVDAWRAAGFRCWQVKPGGY